MTLSISYPQILDQVSPTPSELDYTQANMEFNADKNRYPHIKPSKSIDYIKKIITAARNSLFCQMIVTECY